MDLCKLILLAQCSCKSRRTFACAAGCCSGWGAREWSEWFAVEIVVCGGKGVASPRCRSVTADGLGSSSLEVTHVCHRGQHKFTASFSDDKNTV